MNVSTDKEYKFSGRVVRNTWDTEDFKIYAIDVDHNKFPDIKQNKYHNVTILGELPTLTEGVEYEIVAYEQDSKYGIGYKVLNIRRNVPTTQEDMYIFLSEILTENQAKVLWEHYPDIVQRVKENRLDDIDLNKLKGIKEYTFNVIVEKITENFCLADLVIEFQGYFNLSMIKKIYKKYTSIDVLKEKLQQDPYKCLCGLAGVGFKTADGILLDIEKVSRENIKKGKPPIIQFDSDLRSSPERCLACLLYLLEENEKNGHTKMSLTELRKECLALVPKCAEHFTTVIKTDSIYYNKETLDVSLRKTYDIEYRIAKVLLHNLHKENNDIWNYDIEKYRNVDGFDLSDEQMDFIKSVCQNRIMILNGSAGCVDCDTEFFDGTRWKPISEYKNGDKVLQYNEDGSAELVYPSRYIKQKADYLWHFKTKNGLDQCISENHMCYYETRWGVKKKEKFSSIRSKHNDNGFTGRFLTTFEYKGQGINLSDDEIRLMIMVFADGCFVNNKKSNYVRINVKEQRKVDRAIQLLNNLSIQYTINKSNDGYTKIHFHVWFNEKHFPDSWYNCSKQQFEVIADEVIHWYGTFSSRERYTTSNKNDADFIQFVFSCVGYRSIIEIANRIGEERIINGKKYVRKTSIYYVSRTKRNKISMSVEARKNRNFGKTKIEPYKTKDRCEYCFTVPSGLLVLRRNNRIFITGNCGKSASTQGLINLLEDNKKTYKLFTPTGKSAKVLSDFTNKPVYTIHRGLGYNPSCGYPWTINKENKLKCDVVIVDEFSMVDIFLFDKLLDAIDFNTTRLVIIGDNAQLCSVGCGNLLHDFMETKLIPTVTLSKVFRYGEGGLMKVATDVRFCKTYLSNNMKNTMTKFGANKDYMFVDLSSEAIPQNVVGLYKKLLSKGYGIEDIQVLTAKNVGDCGTVTLNNMIQKVANPNYGSKVFLKSDDTAFFEGDLIIQKVNNYKAEMDIESMDEWEREFYSNQEDKPTAFIANGETGIIKQIYNSYMIIDFDGIMVKYYKSDLSMIGLGYSITIHKSQGSSIKIVILCTPQSHIFMLNSNLLYVGLTRMKEVCYHLGTLTSVNQAVGKKANLTRHTFMQHLLTTMPEEEYNAPELDNEKNRKRF